MKSYNIAATALLLSVSVGLAACSDGQHTAADQSSVQASREPASAGNPGAGESDHVVSDSWITTKVKTELGTTKGVDGSDISVKTVNGVVTLIGVLDNDVAVDKAVASAKSVKGVKSVDASGLKAK